MKTKTRENERRDSAIIIILILLLGFFCIIITSGWALRFSPSWKLDTNMGSNLNPNSDFLTSRPVGFFEPLDPAILTNPPWFDTFLTPGVLIPTRVPALPTITATSTPPKTSTPVTPTLIPSATNTLIIVASPTNTKVTVPPLPSTATPMPTATNTPIPSADLQVTKTDGVASYIPGNTLTYTITVRNNGTNAVNSAVVADNIPTQITAWTWVCTSQNGGATGCNGVVGSSANFTDTVNLPNGASIVYTVTANISSAATGLLVNTANVTVPVGYVDPIPVNNTATDTDTANPQTNLGITKDDGSLTYTPGNAISYTIVVSNAGPSNAIGASVADTIPAAITGTTINCVASGTASCGTNTSAGNNLSYTGVNITAGAGNFLTITASGTVNPATTGDLANTATVMAGAGQSDPTLVNNTATDTDSQFIPLIADLQITKDDGVTAYTAGGTLTYVITVTNTGPSGVTGVVVADAIPVSAQIASWAWACTSQNNGATGCDAAASNSANFTDIVNLPNSASIEYTVTATISAGAAGSLTNIASVNVPGGYFDPAPGNNSATDTDAIILPVDLQITKTDGVAVYTPGNTLTYTITVTNNGPYAVNGATVTDTFPAQIISATWACSSLTGGTCTASGSGNINDLVNLPVGATVTYTVTANTSVNAAGVLENTAIVSTPGGYTETAPGNNQSKDVDTPTSTEPDIGPPDGNDFVVSPGSSIKIIFSPPIIANGDTAPDFVYYEIRSSPASVDLDWVMIEISSDGITWYQVFFWGDGLPETNSNVDISVIGGTEADNRQFLLTDLYNSTGITVDVDTNVPPGSYPWMRISSPAGSANGANVDAIEVLP